MNSQWPEGLVTALVTPLRDDHIDTGALEQLLEFQIASGVAGVVVCGATGEFGALTFDERYQLATEVRSTLDGRLPFIVHTGAVATRDAIALATHAEEIGAAGLLVSSTFGEPIIWRERRRFYEDIDAATSLPIMIYNTPPAGLLSLGQIEDLASLANVSAIKESSGDAKLLGDVIAWSHENDFAVYNGFDSLISFGAASGAHGALVGVGNVVPREVASIWRDADAGNGRTEGTATWASLRTLIRFMEESGSYFALCKIGLKLSGIDVGEVRAPYLMPSEAEEHEFGEHLAAVRRAFEQLEYSTANP